MPTIGRDTLQQSIGSVAYQTFGNWHLNVIFDGIEPTIKDYDKISVFKIDGPNNDSGATARNTGALYANTEWLMWLDDDDEYFPDALINVSNIIDQNPDCDMIKTSGIPLYNKRKHARTKKRVRIFGQVNHTDIMTIGIACKTKLFRETRGWTNDVNKHDSILWADLLKAGGTPFISHIVTFAYRR